MSLRRQTYRVAGLPESRNRRRVSEVARERFSPGLPRPRPLARAEKLPRSMRAYDNVSLGRARGYFCRIPWESHGGRKQEGPGSSAGDGKGEERSWIRRQEVSGITETPAFHDSNIASVR